MHGRRLLGGLGVVGAALLVAACGSSHHAAAVTGATTTTTAQRGFDYGPITGRRLSASERLLLAQTTPQPGLPAWASAPTADASARMPTPGAVVVPFRSGPGWCLGALVHGRPVVSWCTPASGPHRALEGGVVFGTGALASQDIRVLARAAHPATRVRVTLASGERVTIPLAHGVAYGVVATRYGAASRPVSVASLDAAGHAIANRPLGWSAARWRTHGPKTPAETQAQLKAMEKAQLSKLRAHPLARQATCTGAHPTPGGGSFTEVWDDGSDGPVVAAILPTGLGDYGGDLYVSSSSKATATLVDAAGRRTAIDLGNGNCAYVKLTAREHARPFRVLWRTATGKAGVERLGDWAGFPTD